MAIREFSFSFLFQFSSIFICVFQSRQVYLFGREHIAFVAT
jgi:hypothetical protein